MARSENCLKCKYCKPFNGTGSSKDWRNDWYCKYYMEKCEHGNKGDDPDNCLLFEAK